MGSVGARTGFNSFLLVRLAFGDKGARPSILLFLYRYWADLESISIYLGLPLRVCQLWLRVSHLGQSK